MLKAVAILALSLSAAAFLWRATPSTEHAPDGDFQREATEDRGAPRNPELSTEPPPPTGVEVRRSPIAGDPMAPKPTQEESTPQVETKTPMVQLDLKVLDPQVNPWVGSVTVRIRFPASATYEHDVPLDASGMARLRFEIAPRDVAPEPEQTILEFVSIAPADSPQIASGHGFFPTKESGQAAFFDHVNLDGDLEAKIEAIISPAPLFGMVQLQSAPPAGSSAMFEEVSPSGSISLQGPSPSDWPGRFPIRSTSFPIYSWSRASWVFLRIGSPEGQRLGSGSIPRGGEGSIYIADLKETRFEIDSKLYSNARVLLAFHAESYSPTTLDHLRNHTTTAKRKDEALWHSMLSGKAHHISHREETNLVFELWGRVDSPVDDRRYVLLSSKPRPVGLEPATVAF